MTASAFPYLHFNNHVSKPITLISNLKNRSLTALSSHWNVLSSHWNVLSPHWNVLSPHWNVLNPHSNVLSPHSNVLIPHSNVLSPYSNVLSPYSNMSKDHVPLNISCFLPCFDFSNYPINLVTNQKSKL